MKLTRVFLDQDLRCAFQGLRVVAIKEKTDLSNATCLFINRKRTQFKLLVNNKYLTASPPGNTRIPLDAL